QTLPEQGCQQAHGARAQTPAASTRAARISTNAAADGVLASGGRLAGRATPVRSSPVMPAMPPRAANHAVAAPSGSSGTNPVPFAWVSGSPKGSHPGGAANPLSQAAPVTVRSGVARDRTAQIASAPT